MRMKKISRRFLLLDFKCVEYPLKREVIDQKNRPCLLWVMSNAVIVFLMLFFMNIANADCIPSVSSQTLNPGNLAVGSNVAVGTEIYDKDTVNINYACDSTSSPFYYGLKAYRPPLSYVWNGAAVFDSGVPGVGYVISIGSQDDFLPAGSTSFMPYDSGTPGKILFHMNIAFIKTGTITPGSFYSGQIAAYIGNQGGGGWQPEIPLYMGGGNVIVMQQSCDLLTPELNVSLGDYLTTDFTAINSTTPMKPVHILLNCPSNVRVITSVDATADTATRKPGAIKLSSGGATGVAVQLLDKNGLGININQQFDVDTTTDAGVYDFNWKARYLQTRSTVTTGNANATATLALSYE